MTPLEHNAVRRLVHEWMQKADADLRAADVLLEQDPPLLYPSCFHSQQAAEKYLKALLTLRQVEFPKTHSMETLLLLVSEQDPDLSQQLQHSTSLTPYGVEVRYPADMPEPSVQETREALLCARHVADVITRRVMHSH